jgi:hypothetical protein
MTRATNAKIAGLTYLLYIAVAFPTMVLFARATSAPGVAEKLAGIAQHATQVRVIVVLGLLTCFMGPVLGVTLYRVTRDEDPDLAMLAMICRVGEGVIGGFGTLTTLGLLWLATTAGANAPDVAAAHTLGAFLLKAQDWNTLISAMFFAVGSTIFSWLLLRGRMVPVLIASLGVLASVLVVTGLPLQLGGFLRGSITQMMWGPMLLFEVTLALWFLIKGVAEPRRSAYLDSSMSA